MPVAVLATHQLDINDTATNLDLDKLDVVVLRSPTDAVGLNLLARERTLAANVNLLDQDIMREVDNRIQARIGTSTQRRIRKFARLHELPESLAEYMLIAFGKQLEDNPAHVKRAIELLRGGPP